MLNHVGSSVWKMCFFLLKCWICWFLGSMGGQQGPNKGKLIHHIQHIQHLSRKKLFFGTRHSTWSNIFNISAERSIFFEKTSLFQGKSSPWPKKCFFQQKESTWPQNFQKCFFSRKIQHGHKSSSFNRTVSFQVLFCFLLFSVSLSLYLRSLLLLHFWTCVSLFLSFFRSFCLSLSLSPSLPFSIYCYPLSLFLDLPPLHSLSWLLTLS